MSNSSKPHPLARQFQDFQRQSAKGYVCPFCTDSDNRFTQELKLWQHAKAQHQDLVGHLDPSDEADARKRLRINAMDRAQKVTRRVTPYIEATSKRSSSDSMKLNLGEDNRSPSPSSRTVSAPSLSLMQHPEKRIGDLEKLSIAQEPQQPVGNSANEQRTASPPYNPLKREPSVDAHNGYMSPRSRRTKALSGASFVSKDPDFDRKAPHVGESDLIRPHGTMRRLFDPENDNPTSNSLPRRSGRQEKAVSTRRVYDSRAHVFRSKKEFYNDTEDSQSALNIVPDLSAQPRPKIIKKPSSQLGGSDREHPLEEDSASTPVKAEDTSESEPEPKMILQPETRPISHDQLVVEVKGIYAGLVMVEAKCIDVDEKQSIAAQEKDLSRRNKLSNEQWQALIGLHKTLLHEHHDFFLASQHPSASPALSKLAAKYSMPARMWRHGIHAFLEVLRHRLPESLDHMLAFIYIAYSMMALLYETVPAFEDTWIECLGDLGRYRMAIEDNDIRDREVWSAVARFWYSKAADKNPSAGRLHHHLAILARPFTLQQLSLYTRALICIQPFESARSSIMTLFTPILDGKESAYHRSSSVETTFIKFHGILFSGRFIDDFDDVNAQLFDGKLDDYIGRVTAKFKEQGVFAAITNISSLFEYGAVKKDGSPKSILRLAFEEVKIGEARKPKSSSESLTDENLKMSETAVHSAPPASNRSIFDNIVPQDFSSSLNTIRHASVLTFKTLYVCLQRSNDKNCFPLIHVSFVFIWSLTTVEKAMEFVEKSIPWTEFCSFINTLAKPELITSRVKADHFPKPEDGLGRPLPEDFVMRGQIWSQSYFPDTWFTDAMIDDEERSLELPSITAPRIERILWLAFQIASLSRWITYDQVSNSFLTTPYVDKFMSHTSQSPEDGFVTGSTQRDQDSVMSGVDQSEDTVKLISSKSSDSPKAQDALTGYSSSKSHSIMSERTKKSPKLGKIEHAMTDIVMTDDGIDQGRYSNPLPKPEDADSTSWLSGDLGHVKSFPKKLDEQDLISDPHKLRIIEAFDSSDDKEPTKV